MDILTHLPTDTLQILEAMRTAQQRVEAPALETPRRPLRVRLVQARRKSAYFLSSFYLEAA